MNKDTYNKLTKARAALILDQPFFGALSLRLQLVEDATKTQTIATDGKILVYNPEFIETCTMDEIKGLVCHEVLHLATAHHLRRNNRDAKVWNEAADYVINPIVQDSGLTLPKGCLFNPDFKDKSTDEVYSILYGKKQEQDSKQPESSSKGNKEQGQEQGKGKADKDSQNAPGEILDGTDETGEELTESEKQEEEQNWKIATTQAANQAKSCGKLSAGIERLVADLNEPKVNWKEALHRFVEQVSKNDYTYKRTNPRYASFGLIMPSLYNQELPPIDVWIDTSGSISESDLKQFASEIDDILNQYNTTARVVYCDTQVNGVEEYKQENRPVKLSMKGGGGTAFSPAIAWSMKQDDLPCCGIYLTDLCCNDFGKEPDFPVLWVQTAGRKGSIPFGELISLDREF